MSTQDLTIQELVPLIQERTKKREICKKITSFNQLLKTREDVGELIKACYDDDRPAIQNAIGDIMITLINYYYMERIDVLEQANDVLNFEGKRADSKVVLILNIQDSLTRLMHANFRLLGIGGEILFLYFYEIITITGYLDGIAFSENTTLKECLNIAYNETKNRAGRIINGKFIKDQLKKKMMQIINNTGAIVKEQIDLGNIDDLDIDDLFKDNTNNKKTKSDNCPNWLVPFDMAFMLGRIDFDEKCLLIYRKSDEIKFKMDLSKVFESTSEYYSGDLEPYEEAPLLCILCPNWEQVFAWFRARGLYSYICPYITPENFYIYSIYDNNNFDKCYGCRDTCEEAQKECVKALIQAYKNELKKSNL